MKIGNFPMVQRIMEARAKLIEQRDQAKLGVTLAGASQDDEHVERVRPIVIRVLNERIADLDQDLQQRGVDVA